MAILFGDYVCSNARACTNFRCRFRGQHGEGFDEPFDCVFGQKKVYCIEKLK